MLFLNSLVIFVSVTICCLLYFVRLPGMELFGITPNWLLIWAIAWSIRRSVWQAAIAGVSLGWIYDGIVGGNPSHSLGLVAVAVITASLNKEKYVGESFVSVSLIVFLLTAIAETIFAFQFAWLGIRPATEVFSDYVRITVISAVITSLWTPAIYIPLHSWWESVRNEKT